MCYAHVFKAYCIILSKGSEKWYRKFLLTDVYFYEK